MAKYESLTGLYKISYKNKGVNTMTRKELLKLLEKFQFEDDGEYYRSGLDDVCRTFLHCLRENEVHQRRRKIFEEYSGYESQY